jgi:hypothetical protein
MPSLNRRSNNLMLDLRKFDLIENQLLLSIFDNPNLTVEREVIFDDGVEKTIQIHNLFSDYD